MKVKVGDTVIHPQHGTAEVTALEKRTIAGVERDYVVLSRPTDALVVSVPIDLVSDVGLRSVVNEDEVAAVLDILGEKPTPADAAWRVQHARNESRLGSGEIRRIAAAVRDLAFRKHERGLSPSDTRIHRDARDRLIGELAAATGQDREQITERIDSRLKEILGTDDVEAE